MISVGIDFDTHQVDVVTLEFARVRWSHFDLTSSGDAFDRARQVPTVLPAPDSTFWQLVAVIAIEEPQGRHRATVAKLKAIQGAVLTCLPHHAAVVPLVPARWRSLVGLKGNASKDDVRRHVSARLGVHDPILTSQDACDAYCLAEAVGLLARTAVPS